MSSRFDCLPLRAAVLPKKAVRIRTRFAILHDACGSIIISKKGRISMKRIRAYAHRYTASQEC